MNSYTLIFSHMASLNCTLHQAVEYYKTVKTMDQLPIRVDRVNKGLISCVICNFMVGDVDQVICRACTASKIKELKNDTGRKSSSRGKVVE